MTEPIINSLWKHSQMEHHKYTVIAITNVGVERPPQVVYMDHEGDPFPPYWSMPLSEWPGLLIPEGGKKVATITKDTDCASPRENDNLGTLCLFHNRYDLPNESKMPAEDLNAWLNSPRFKGVWLPVWGYDHSGLSCKAGDRSYPYGCEWDSGQLGVIYVEDKKLAEELITSKSLAEIRDMLIAEVEEFNRWLTGDCYGYRIVQDGVELDSCWGFIGLDTVKEAAIEEGEEEIVEE